jgi:hypothetical protein
LEVVEVCKAVGTRDHILLNLKKKRKMKEKKKKKS